MQYLGKKVKEIWGRISTFDIYVFINRDSFFVTRFLKNYVTGLGLGVRPYHRDVKIIKGRKTSLLNGKPDPF